MKVQKLEPRLTHKIANTDKIHQQEGKGYREAEQEQKNKTSDKKQQQHPPLHLALPSLRITDWVLASLVARYNELEYG
jgi:hypothetical protein